MKKILNIFVLLLMAFGLYSCSSDVETAETAKGYIQLELKTAVSTNTRAVENVPASYAPKTLLVRILDDKGVAVKSAIWKDGEFDSEEFASPIMLDPGKYTIDAHSANWDGSGSGWNAPFYAGSTDVTVTAGHLSKKTVLLTQDNVKVEVFWDQSFMDNFTSAMATISVEDNTDVASRAFIMGQNPGAAYFPVSTLVWQLSATNKKGARNDDSNTITGLKARDYVKVTYSVAEAGKAGSMDVYLDEATNTYTVTINVPRESTISLTANNVTDVAATAESGTAQLSGVLRGKDLKTNKVVMKYKKVSDSEWTEIPNDQLTISAPDDKGAVTYSYTLSMTSSPFDYEYCLEYTETGTKSNAPKFRINGGEALYNGGFELGYYNGEIAYLNESSAVKYWDSSNKGGSLVPALAKSTDRNTEYKHGGTYSAKLESHKMGKILAAASLYTGEFGSVALATQIAQLKWGVPFTSRPKSLHGYMMYIPGNVDVVATSAKDGTPLPKEAPGSGDLDHCHIFCALMNINSPLEVTNGDMSSFPNWEDRTDSRIIAYGIKVQTEKQSNWVEIDIPLDYYQTDVMPKYLVIVAAASKYGDYFHGSSTSILYLDDFEFRY